MCYKHHFKSLQTLLASMHNSFLSFRNSTENRISQIRNNLVDIDRKNEFIKQQCIHTKALRQHNSRQKPQTRITFTTFSASKHSQPQPYTIQSNGIRKNIIRNQNNQRNYSHEPSHSPPDLLKIENIQLKKTIDLLKIANSDKQNQLLRQITELQSINASRMPNKNYVLQICKYHNLTILETTQEKDTQPKQLHQGTDNNQSQETKLRYKDVNQQKANEKQQLAIIEKQEEILKLKQEAKKVQVQNLELKLKISEYQKKIFHHFEETQQLEQLRENVQIEKENLNHQIEKLQQNLKKKALQIKQTEEISQQYQENCEHLMNSVNHLQKVNMENQKRLQQFEISLESLYGLLFPDRQGKKGISVLEDIEGWIAKIKAEQKMRELQIQNSQERLNQKLEQINSLRNNNIELLEKYEYLHQIYQLKMAQYQVQKAQAKHDFDESIQAIKDHTELIRVKFNSQKQQLEEQFVIKNRKIQELSRRMEEAEDYISNVVNDKLQSQIALIKQLTDQKADLENKLENISFYEQKILQLESQNHMLKQEKISAVNSLSHELSELQWGQQNIKNKLTIEKQNDIRRLMNQHSLDLRQFEQKIRQAINREQAAVLENQHLKMNNQSQQDYLQKVRNQLDSLRFVHQSLLLQKQEWIQKNKNIQKAAKQASESVLMIEKQKQDIRLEMVETKRYNNDLLIQIKNIQRQNQEKLSQLLFYENQNSRIKAQNQNLLKMYSNESQQLIQIYENKLLQVQAMSEEQKQALQNQIAQFQQTHRLQKNSIEAQIANFIQENNELKELLKQQRLNSQKQSTQQNPSLDTIKALEQKNQIIFQQLERAQNYITDRENEILILAEEINAFKIYQYNTQMKNATLCEESKLLEQKNRDLMQDKMQKEILIEKINHDNTKLLEEIQSLKKRIEQLIRQQSIASNNMMDFANKSDYQNQVKQMADLVETFKQQSEIAVKRLEVSLKEIQGYKTDFEALKFQNDQLSRQLIVAEMRLEELTTSNLVQTESYQKISTQLNQIKHTDNTMKAQNQSLKTQNQSLLLKLNQFTSQTRQLREQTLNLSRALQQLNSKVIETERENEQLKYKFANSQQKLEHLALDLSRMNIQKLNLISIIEQERNEHQMEIKKTLDLQMIKQNIQQTTNLTVTEQRQKHESYEFIRNKLIEAENYLLGLENQYRLNQMKRQELEDTLRVLIEQNNMQKEQLQKQNQELKVGQSWELSKRQLEGRNEELKRQILIQKHNAQQLRYCIDQNKVNYQKEVKKYQDMIQNLHQSIKSLEDHQISLPISLQPAVPIKQDSDLLQSKLIEAENYICQAENYIDQLKLQIANLNLQISQMSQEKMYLASQLGSKLRQQQSENAVLIQKNKLMEIQNRKYETQLFELNSECNHLKTQKNQIQKIKNIEVNAMVCQIQVLQKRIEILQNEKQKIQQQKQIYQQKITKTNQSFSNQTSVTQQQYDELRSHFQLLSLDSASHKQQLRLALEKIKSMEDSISKSSNQQQKYIEIQKLVRNFEIEKKELEFAIERKNKQMESIQADNLHLIHIQSQLYESQQTNLLLQNQILIVLKERQEAQQENMRQQNLNYKLNEKIKQLEQSRSLVNHLQQTNPALQKQVMILRQSLVKAEDFISLLENEVIKNLELELVSLKQQKYKESQLTKEKHHYLEELKHKDFLIQKYENEKVILSKMEAERKEQISHLSELQQKNQSLETKIAGIEEVLCSLELVNISLKKINQTHEQRQKQQMNSIKQLQNQLKILVAQKKSFEVKFKQTQRLIPEVELLRLQNSEIIDALQKCQKTIEQLQQQKVDSQKLYIKLQQSYSMIGHLELQISLLKHAKKVKEQQAEQKDKQQIINANNKIAFLESKIKQAEDYIDEIEISLQSLQQLKATNSALTNQIFNLRLKINYLEQTQNQVEFNSNRLVQEKVFQLAETNKQAEIEISLLKIEIAQLNNENQKLFQEVKTLQKSSHTNHETNFYQQNSSKLVQELQKAHKQISLFQQKLKQQHEKGESLRVQVIRYQQSVQILSQNLSQSQTYRIFVEEQRQNLKHLLQQLNQKCQNLQSLLSKQKMIAMQQNHKNQQERFNWAADQKQLKQQMLRQQYQMRQKEELHRKRLQIQEKCIQELNQRVKQMESLNHTINNSKLSENEQERIQHTLMLQAEDLKQKLLKAQQYIDYLEEQLKKLEQENNRIKIQHENEKEYIVNANREHQSFLKDKLYEAEQYIQSIQKERAQLNQHILSSEQRLHKHLVAQKETEKQTFILKSENQVFSKLVQQRQKEINHVKSQIIANAIKIDSINHQLATAIAQNQTLLEKIISYEKIIENQIKFEQSQSPIQQSQNILFFQKKLMEAQEYIKLLESERPDIQIFKNQFPDKGDGSDGSSELSINDKVVQAKNSIDEIKKDSEANLISALKSHQQLELDFEQLLLQIERFEYQNKQQLQELKKRQEKIISLSQNQIMLKEEIKHLKQKINQETRKDAQQIREQLHRLKSSCANYELALSQSKASLLSNELVVRQLTQAKQVIIRKNQALESQIQQLSGNVENLQLEIVSLNAQLSDLKRSVEAYRNNQRDYETKMRKMLATEQQMVHRITELQASNQMNHEKQIRSEQVFKKFMNITTNLDSPNQIFEEFQEFPYLREFINSILYKLQLSTAIDLEKSLKLKEYEELIESLEQQLAESSKKEEEMLRKQEQNFKVLLNQIQPNGKVYQFLQEILEYKSLNQNLQDQLKNFMEVLKDQKKKIEQYDEYYLRRIDNLSPSNSVNNNSSQIHQSTNTIPHVSNSEHKINLSSSSKLSKTINTQLYVQFLKSCLDQIGQLEDNIKYFDRMLTNKIQIQQKSNSQIDKSNDNLIQKIELLQHTLVEKRNKVEPYSWQRQLQNNSESEQQIMNLNNSQEQEIQVLKGQNRILESKIPTNIQESSKNQSHSNLDQNIFFNLPNQLK